MLRLLHPLFVSLLLASVYRSHSLGHQLDDGGEAPQWGQLKGKNLSQPVLPADFHRENTVTNDWIADGEEDEDYLDLEKILGEDDDYIDIVDAAPPTDPAASAASALLLFPGKSRIQRLNVLNAQFAFDLYRALKEQTSAADNVFLAPVGISVAMGMISLGLRGQTHEQVHAALHFTDFVNASSKYEPATVHNLFRKLTHRLFRRNFGYTLRSVNDLYVQRQFPVRDDFRTQVRQYYFAEVQVADFSDPAFISKTNHHISKLTKGLIRDALENIDPATQMMVLNCIYFKGKNRRHGLSASSRHRSRHTGTPNILPQFTQETKIPGQLTGTGKISVRGQEKLTLKNSALFTHMSLQHSLVRQAVSSVPRPANTRETEMLGRGRAKLAQAGVSSTLVT